MSREVQFLGTKQAISRFREEHRFVLEDKAIGLKACRISLAETTQVKFRWLACAMKLMHLMKCSEGADLCELPPGCIEFTERCTIAQGSERTVFTQLHRCPFKEQAVSWLKRENCAERQTSERHLHHLSQAAWICSPHGSPQNCSHHPLQTLSTTPCRESSIFTRCAPLQNPEQQARLFQAFRCWGQQQQDAGLAAAWWKSCLYIKVLTKTSLWGIISLQATIASLSCSISVLPWYYLTSFLCAVNLLFLSWSFALHSNYRWFWAGTILRRRLSGGTCSAVGAWKCFSITGRKQPSCPSWAALEVAAQTVSAKIRTIQKEKAQVFFFVMANQCQSTTSAQGG